MREGSMRVKANKRTWLAGVVVAAAATLIGATNIRAQESAAVAVSVKGHKFQPAELHAPPNKRIAITVKNLDSAAIEFESVSLRVEKVVAPGSEGVVNVRALAPGRYEFFDDFHQDTRGVLVVQ
jgi:plastocyanin